MIFKFNFKLDRGLEKDGNGDVIHKKRLNKEVHKRNLR